MTNHTSVQHRINSLRAGIEEYTGKNVTDIKVYEDPKVSYTFAIRVSLAGDIADFLIVGAELEHSIALSSPEVIADHLEECEFKTWPPKSGNLRFFV